jgi:hypothetical protein
VSPLGFLDTALLFFGAALAGTLFATAFLWRRLQADARELPVWHLLRRPSAPALAADKLREAELRCMLCSSQRDCRQRILTGAPAPSHCPNDSLFQAKSF